MVSTRNILYAYLVPLSLVVCTALTAQSVSAQQPSSMYNDAVSLIRSGDFQGGCAKAEELAHSYPSFYAAYNLLGICATQRGDAQRAESFFRKSIELNSKFIDSRNNLAVNLMQRGNRPAAVAQFIGVLKLDPNNVTALYNLGKVELVSGSLGEGIKHLRRAIDLAPDDVQISLTLADALLASREMGPARDLINQIIQRQQNGHVLLSAALLAVQAGEDILAREGLEKAVHGDPNIRGDILGLARMASAQQRYKVVHILLDAVEQSGKDTAEWNALQGYADYKLGEPARALERLRRAIELNPNVEDFYMKIGELMLFHNSGQAAIAFFEAGLKKLPNSSLLHFGLAVSYMADGTKPEAVREHLETALLLQPDFQPALSLLCLTSYREKDWPRLQDAAERLIHLNPRSHEGYYYKAAALVESRSNEKQGSVFEEAKQLLQQSIRLNPDFADSHIALGKLLVKVDQISPAVVEFERSTTLNPESIEAYYLLGKAYQRAGLKEKSIQAFNEFEKLEAKNQQQLAAGWKVLFQVSK